MIMMMKVVTSEKEFTVRTETRVLGPLLNLWAASASCANMFSWSAPEQKGGMAGVIQNNNTKRICWPPPWGKKPEPKKKFINKYVIYTQWWTEWCPLLNQEAESPTVTCILQAPLLLKLSHNLFYSILQMRASSASGWLKQAIINY